jgi:hypothetical protein
MQHIKMAMEGYCQAYGCYPPEYLVDEQGRPAHSWRILILPYMGYNELYRRYRFDERWNGPHNRLLAMEMPEEYCSPFANPSSGTTQYVGIAGEATVWQGTTIVRRKDMQQTVSKPVICFVEVANSGVNWMEPRDIPLEQAMAGINVPEGRGIQSNYSDGLPAQMLPYGYEWVSVSISPEDFRSKATLVVEAADRQK